MSKHMKMIKTDKDMKKFVIFEGEAPKKIDPSPSYLKHVCSEL